MKKYYDVHPKMPAGLSGASGYTCAAPVEALKVFDHEPKPEPGALRWWLLLARYRWRNGEFEARLPFGDKARARAAIRELKLRGRVEGGTAVFSGWAAVGVVTLLGAPVDVISQARLAARAPSTSERARAWDAFQEHLLAAL
jgi:hypothetical protein